MKVYLCGGINGLSDADAKDWREQAKYWLDARLDAVDPMRRDYRGVEDQNYGQIVRGDLDDIDECRFVLAMCMKPSWGTAMEIYHAHTTGRIVYIVTPSGPISPWLRAHSNGRFTSLRQACDAVNLFVRLYA